MKDAIDDIIQRPQSYDTLRRYATYASIGVATTLIIAKFFAYILTDSVALLSTLIDSIVDLFASCIAAYGVAQALKPPDSEHRFGHGKAEALASLVQGAFIAGSAMLLAFEAMGRIYTPQEVHNETIGQIVMIFAIVLTFGLVAFQRYAVHKTGSFAIGADSLHYTGDVLINGSVMATLYLQGQTGLLWLDPLFALGIVFILMFGAWKITQKSLRVLMDRELSREDRARIIEAALSHPDTRGVHDVRTRFDGDHIFIEMHLEMEPDLLLTEAHNIADDVELIIKKLFPKADVIIHQDPVGVDEYRLDRQIDNQDDKG